MIAFIINLAQMFSHIAPAQLFFHILSPKAFFQAAMFTHQNPLLQIMLLKVLLQWKGYGFKFWLCHHLLAV